MFEVAKGSGTITTLASFDGTDGNLPNGGLALDAAGNLYGTTNEGGADGDGTVFEIARGSGTITTLASFDGNDGEFSSAGPVLDTAGDLFGTAFQGGADGAGTVFEIVDGSDTLTTLASFDVSDGQYPGSGLTVGSGDNLYGEAGEGGVDDDGTVFELPAPLPASLALTSITPVSPNPRNTTISSIDATFSEPIDTSSLNSGALTLTDNGGANLIGSGATVTLVSGTTYAIGGLAGLTTAEGEYTLTVNAADIKDQNGDAGTGSLSTSWLIDTTPPISTVNALPAQSASASFTVSVTASDPSTAGETSSGVASIAIYDSVNGGGFTLFTTLTPSHPSATFTGQVGDTYGFYSIATDNAGNAQATPSGAQATTKVIGSSTTTPTPTPTPSPTQTVIVREQALFNRKLNKKGKPTGKPTLAGFTLDFSVPLNAAAAENPANYQVDTVTTKKVKKKKEAILHPITKFTVSYLAASDAVEITLGAKETFPTGGQITVSGGLTTASGGTLSGPAIFTISAGGRTVSSQ